MATACPACHAPNDPASESCFTCGQALHGNTLRLGSVVAGRYELQSQLGRVVSGRGEAHCPAPSVTSAASMQARSRPARVWTWGDCTME